MQQYGFPKLHFFQDFRVLPKISGVFRVLGILASGIHHKCVRVPLFLFSSGFLLDFGFLGTYPNNTSLGVYYVKEIDPEENNVSVLKRLHLSTTSDLFIQSMSKQLQYSMYSKKKYYPWPLLAVVLAVCWANTVLKGASTQFYY